MQRSSCPGTLFTKLLLAPSSFLFPGRLSHTFYLLYVLKIRFKKLLLHSHIPDMHVLTSSGSWPVMFLLIFFRWWQSVEPAIGVPFPVPQWSSPWGSDAHSPFVKMGELFKDTLPPSDLALSTVREPRRAIQRTL